MSNIPGEVLLNNPTSASIWQSAGLENLKLNGRSLTALVAAGSIMLGACSSDTEASIASSLDNTAVATSAVSSASELSTAISDGSLVTDAELAQANFACGGEKDSTSMHDFTYKSDFFADKPELSASFVEVSIDSKVDGMGRPAFELLKEHALRNPNYKGEIANADLNDLFSMIDGTMIPETTIYKNGDCRHNENKEIDMPSLDTPTIALKGLDENSTAEVVVLNSDKIEEFKLLVADHQDTGDINFDIFPIYKANNEVLWAVVLFANGCDNPIRLAGPNPEVPVTPATTDAPIVPENPVASTTTTSTLHPPANGPPPEATIPPQTDTATPTDGYVPGNAEAIDGTQNGNPTNLQPTENGTEVPGSQNGGFAPGGGDQSVIAEPSDSAPVNSQYIPGSESTGSNAGTSTDANSGAAQTPASNTTLPAAVATPTTEAGVGGF